MNQDEFVDLYFRTVQNNHFLGWFLQGHLVIEYILRKILIAYDFKLERLVNSLNHAKIVSTVYELQLINEEQKIVLVEINKIRNKFAHRVDYMPSIGECLNLWRKAQSAFTDLTDGIAQGLENLESIQELRHAEDYAVKELFVQISYDLESVYKEVSAQNLE